MYLPSPLRDVEVPLVKLHFRIDPNGKVTVPYDDIAPIPAPSRSSRSPKPMLKDRKALVDEIAKANKSSPLMARLPEPPEQVAVITPELAFAKNTDRGNQRDQQILNRNEFQSRMVANSSVQSQRGIGQFNWSLYTPSREGRVRKFWIDDRLLLARRIGHNGKEHVVGCWMDWPKIRSELKDKISDLLPNAELRPVVDEKDREEPGMLVTLPVRLEPGKVEPTVGLDAQAAILPLSIAWAGILLAGISVAVLLGGVLALSERRTTFATAVTHELRTPLTSMRMYTEMLSDGMITDEQKREEYLTTLHGETIRLCDLVENVLSFGKMESKGAAAEKEDVTVDGLIERLLPRIEERAQDAGMELVVDAGEAARSVKLNIHKTGIEQVIVNLVDNACKYASGAEDRRIHLELRPNGRGAEFSVRDHGPGIDPAETGRIFQPFFKASKDSAGTKGGVGLGLALSRRIAKKNGGDLVYRPAEGGGARFILTF
jgi:two-component sensor histidine kinase